MSLQQSVARAQSMLKEQPGGRLPAKSQSLCATKSAGIFHSRIWVYLLAVILILILLTITSLSCHNTDPASNRERHWSSPESSSFTTPPWNLLCLHGDFYVAVPRRNGPERTLHYQFLVPVRKEVLVVGKFLAGAIISIALFETAVLACLPHV